MKISELVGLTSAEVKDLKSKTVLVVTHHVCNDGFELTFKPMINVGPFIENNKDAKLKILLQYPQTQMLKYLANNESIIKLDGDLKQSVLSFLEGRLQKRLPETLMDFESGQHSILLFTKDSIKCVTPIAFSEDQFILSDPVYVFAVKSFNDEDVCPSLNDIEEHVSKLIDSHDLLKNLNTEEELMTL